MLGYGMRACGPRFAGRFRGMVEELRHGGDRAGSGGRHGHDGGGRRRRFDGTELRLVLLRMIADEPRHGYDLIRAIEEMTGGVYAPSPGVVYPTLTMLGDMGLVTERESGGQRRVFEATEAGRSMLAEKAEEIDKLFARLIALGEAESRSDVAPIRRAMHNLRNVLRHKLVEEKLDRERMHQAVALIDEVAGKIERL